ncbi:MgtC/SapB family protein, partial [bacterium]|nr:MgtC/SapB family protein [bacterium]
MLIGAERIFAGKIAGMRTYALVSMGSALFI